MNHLTLFTMFTKQSLFTVGLSFTLSLSLQAESVNAVGVFGNSGEAGDTLVRFQPEAISGMGVVYDDSTGALWSSGGKYEIKCYTVDGRQVGTYPVGHKGRQGSLDKLSQIGDSLVINMDDRLYRLPINAPDGTEAEELSTRADRISFNSTPDGWGVGSLGGDVFRFNLAGDVEPLGTLDGSPRDIEVGGDGEIILFHDWKHKSLADLDTNIDMPGDKSQWLNGAWFGHAYHGTIRRFNENLEMDPGVVLGGNSGSFIGYVPGNYEINKGEGMAYLGDNIYAVSGSSGILHLMQWKSEELRFEIIRRIGSVRGCKALALDSQGNVWYHGGVWKWSDGPDAPLEHGVPHAGAPIPANKPNEGEAVAAEVMDNDILVAIAPFRNGRGVLFSGALDYRSQRDTTDDSMESYVDMEVMKLKKRNVAVLARADGTVKFLSVGTNGRPHKEMGEVALKTSKPIQRLDAIAAGPKNSLWVSADGELLLLAQSGDTWQETKRWKGWGDDESRQFGNRFYLDADAGRLWISDTERNRVGVFDVSDGELKAIGGVGNTDAIGDAISELNAPGVIAANGRRAVVYDSGNQRIVKLELSE